MDFKATPKSAAAPMLSGQKPKPTKKKIFSLKKLTTIATITTTTLANLPRPSAQNKNCC